MCESSYQDRGFIVNVLFPEIIPLVIISILYQFERPYVSFHHYGDACVFFCLANRSKILYRVARTQNDCSKRNSNIRTYATPSTLAQPNPLLGLSPIRSDSTSVASLIA